MPQPDDLVKTGIHGLDDILLGGIPRGNVVVVTGSPGTGKTTLGIEFIYRGAREFDDILVEALHRESITAMFALDAPVDRAAVGAMPEDFIADTIIRLGLEPVRRAVVRSIQVVKSRGQEYLLGTHSFRVVNR